MSFRGSNRWAAVAGAVLIASLVMANTAQAICKIDWDNNGQVTQDDYLVGDPMGGFYAEWYIYSYYPSYYPILFPAGDTARLDFNLDGVVDNQDLMGPLDVAAQSEGFYVEWYIYIYYPAYYPVFIPESTCGQGCATGDDDGDGVCNDEDVCPGKDDSIDVDGDQVIDCLDTCIDSDGDSVCDRRDLCPGEDDTIDVDDDGKGDCYDSCIDMDSDGTCDADDVCPGEPDRDLDSNGVTDCLEVYPCDSGRDIDQDGVDDCTDGCPLNYNKQDPGICGCDGNDSDYDGDGVVFCNDECPNDPDKSVAGNCGCHQVEDPTDSDGDGVVDCADPCPLNADDDPDGDGLCGTSPIYCAAEGDKDNDRICDANDACVGNDAFGDSDGDGYCEDVDECVGNDLLGDDDADGVCNDLDICTGRDSTGDWNENGICNDQEAGCSNVDTADFDGDGICNWDDPCFSDPFNDLDNDGYCELGDNCRGDRINDDDRDGVCAYEEFCPLDGQNDKDQDGLCANVDLCLGDNATGDSDGDSICDDLDICIGVDILGDADGDGYCDEEPCPGDVPAFYDQTSNEVDWAAGGVCVEAVGVSGPPACPNDDFTHYRDAMNWIMTNYPFTAAVFDAATGGGQTFGQGPYKLICSGMPSEPEIVDIFDDLNNCYHASSRCLFGCNFVYAEFDWGVNVWDLLSVYDSRAAQFGGICGLNTLSGVPTGFHAQLYGGMILWTVRSTETCDLPGCRCDATLEIWSDPANPGWYQENSLTNDSKFYIFEDQECTDQRFNF